MGSNIGDSRENLFQAKDILRERIGKIDRVSSVYVSEPWGFEAEQVFLNQVLLMQTDMDPAGILEEIKQIEREMGRVRTATEGYESRKIDIDILFYDDIVYHSEHLTIPHPLLQERRFALLPLHELSPEGIHPVYRKSVRELLKACPDKSEVKKYPEDH